MHAAALSKRVARLMRAAGLRWATLRKSVVTTHSAPQRPEVADLVERRYKIAERGNKARSFGDDVPG